MPSGDSAEKLARKYRRHLPLAACAARRLPVGPGSCRVRFRVRISRDMALDIVTEKRRKESAPGENDIVIDYDAAGRDKTHPAQAPEPRR